MLTIREASEQSRLSKSLLYELCRLKRLKHYRVGAKGKGRILIEQSDLDELLKHSRVEGPPADEDEHLTYLK